MDRLQALFDHNPVVVYGALVIFAMLLAYGMWNAQRWLNWEFSYNDGVRIAICDLVKPEALIDPSVCE